MFNKQKCYRNENKKQPGYILFIFLILIFIIQGKDSSIYGEDSVTFPIENFKIKNIDKIVDIIRHPPIKNLKERIFYSNMNVIERINREPLSNPVRIVFIADTAGYSEYKLMIAQMENLEKKPVAVFHGGDFCKSGRLKHYRKNLEIIKKYPFNIVHIPGNHDLTREGRYLFKKIFGKTYSAFTYKNLIKFIFINNADKKKLGKYGMDKRQFKWFKKELQKKGPPIKIVLGHVPPNMMFKKYSNNIFFLLNSRLLREKEFLEVMKKNQVGIYLCGHHHFGSTLMDEKLRIIISGGGGQRLGIGGKLKTPLFTIHKHFTVLDIDYINKSYSGYMVKMGQNPNIKDSDLCFAGRFPKQ